MAPMAFKHFTLNFERARTFTFVHVHVLDVRERAPPVTPNFGICASEWQKTDDVQRKVQQCHLDALLLLTEQIVDIAFHPVHRVLAFRTTHGRFLTLTFQLRRIREQTRRQWPFRKFEMVQLRFNPSRLTMEKLAYLLLLTSHASIIADRFFGLIACSISASTAVQIFSRVVDGLPALHHAVSRGLDTPRQREPAQRPAHAQRRLSICTTSRIAFL